MYVHVCMYVFFTCFLYVCTHFFNCNDVLKYTYMQVRFLEKFYLYMFSNLVHFRLVSFLEKFYIFRKTRKRRKKEEEEKVLYMQKLHF